MTDELPEISVTDAKYALKDIVQRIKDGTPMALTRHGRPVSVIMSIVTYRELMAKIAK